MDHFSGASGGFNAQQAMVTMAALGNQAIGLQHGPSASARHMPQPVHQANPLADVYGVQNGMYSSGHGIQGQGSFGQTHMAPQQLHTMQPQSVDGYVLQGNSGHNQGISPSHSHGNGFSGGFNHNNVGGFGVGITAGGLNDPYQRATFGYGM